MLVVNKKLLSPGVNSPESCIIPCKKNVQPAVLEKILIFPEFDRNYHSELNLNQIQAHLYVGGRGSRD